MMHEKSKKILFTKSKISVFRGPGVINDVVNDIGGCVACYQRYFAMRKKPCGWGRALPLYCTSGAILVLTYIDVISLET